MNVAFFEAFYALVDTLVASTEVKVVVFDSVSPDFWMAHFDVNAPTPPELITAWWPNIQRLAKLPVLTVAALREISRGGGAEAAAALDIRFASKEKAKLCQIEVGVGLVPGVGGIEMLSRLVGRARALEIVLSADDYDADTMERYGWVNRAVPDADFDGFVDRFAHRVAGWDREAIRVAKDSINRRAGFPTVEEVQKSFAAFAKFLGEEKVVARLAKQRAAGLGTDVDLELTLAEQAENYAGDA